MKPISAVTVYCSSSGRVDAVYREAAERLGGALAKQGWTLVYGGNRAGMMAVLADACRHAGGRVVGITPRSFVDSGIGDSLCDELIITETIRERKQLLEQGGDALVTLPGGLGTLEEFFEVLVAKALGHHAKPIVLADIAGYYKPLMAMIRHGTDLKFIRPQAAEQFFVAESIDEVIDYLVGQGPAAPPG